jgi:stearoyl-CoA desaturase (delta-9 desaturase)
MVGHYCGYRNWDCPDASTNVFPWGILIGGEELHNNHHAFASSAKLSSKWYEFDIGWMYIRIMSLLGLATVRRLAPKPKFAQAKPVIDVDTLQAVIAHRYDMMAAFADSLRRACAEEARRLGSNNGREVAALTAARRWLVIDAGKWTAEQKARRRGLCRQRQRAQLVGCARNWLDLGAFHAEQDQLLVQLQQWLTRAETGGMRPLGPGPWVDAMQPRWAAPLRWHPI